MLSNLKSGHAKVLETENQLLFLVSWLPKKAEKGLRNLYIIGQKDKNNNNPMTIDEKNNVGN